MNLMETARQQAADIVRAAYEKAAAAGDLPQAALPEPVVETPKDAANGDWACTIAMQGAKVLHMAPRKIAEALVGHMVLDGTYFKDVSIAGPGFLNFTYGMGWYQDAIRAVMQQGADYGKSKAAKPEKIMVEFVSANPTGPMHMGNARGGVLGDCLAEVLSWAGHDVTREFYINDARWISLPIR